MRKLLALTMVLLLVLCSTVTVWAYEPYEDPYEYEDSESQLTTVQAVLICLAIGAVLGGIVVLIMASQLKSVRKKGGAGDYVRSGSMRLHISSDLYLYQNTTRIAKPKEDSRK